MDDYRTSTSAPPPSGAPTLSSHLAEDPLLRVAELLGRPVYYVPSQLSAPRGVTGRAHGQWPLPSPVPRQRSRELGRHRAQESLRVVLTPTLLTMALLFIGGWTATSAYTLENAPPSPRTEADTELATRLTFYTTAKPTWEPRPRTSSSVGSLTSQSVVREVPR